MEADKKTDQNSLYLQPELDKIRKSVSETKKSSTIDLPSNGPVREEKKSPLSSEKGRVKSLTSELAKMRASLMDERMGSTRDLSQKDLPQKTKNSHKSNSTIEETSRQKDTEYKTKKMTLKDLARRETPTRKIKRVDDEPFLSEETKYETRKMILENLSKREVSLRRISEEDQKFDEDLSVEEFRVEEIQEILPEEEKISEVAPLVEDFKDEEIPEKLPEEEKKLEVAPLVEEKISEETLPVENFKVEEIQEAVLEEEKISEVAPQVEDFKDEEIPEKLPEEEKKLEEIPIIDKEIAPESKQNPLKTSEEVKYIVVSEEGKSYLIPDVMERSVSVDNEKDSFLLATRGEIQVQGVIDPPEDLDNSSDYHYQTSLTEEETEIDDVYKSISETMDTILGSTLTVKASDPEQGFKRRGLFKSRKTIPLREVEKDFPPGRDISRKDETENKEAKRRGLFSSRVGFLGESYTEDALRETKPVPVERVKEETKEIRPTREKKGFLRSRRGQIKSEAVLPDELKEKDLKTDLTKMRKEAMAGRMGRILDLKPDEVLPPKIEEDVPVKKFEPDLDKIKKEVMADRLKKLMASAIEDMNHGTALIERFGGEEKNLNLELDRIRKVRKEVMVDRVSISEKLLVEDVSGHTCFEYT